MSEKTALAHRELECETANGQTFESFSGSDVNGRFEDRLACTFTLRFASFGGDFPRGFSKLSFGHARVYSTNVRFTSRIIRRGFRSTLCGGRVRPSPLASHACPDRATRLAATAKRRHARSQSREARLMESTCRVAAPPTVVQFLAQSGREPVPCSPDIFPI